MSNAQSRPFVADGANAAAAGIFLRAHWRYLALLNYAIDPALLAGRIPPGTEIDLFDGRTYVSVVGFRFLRTRVLGIAVPLHQDFDEINLRFYVRRKAEDGWRRGVVFVRELVPKAAIAFVARAGFSEPYLAVPMTHEISDEGKDAQRSLAVRYGWRTSDSAGAIELHARGEPSFPGQHSLERFIAEHYWGYGTDRKGCGLEYAVRHDPWRLWIADRASFTGDAAAAYGSDLARVLARPPDSSFLAEGSPVTVSWASRLAR